MRWVCVGCVLGVCWVFVGVSPRRPVASLLSLLSLFSLLSLLCLLALAHMPIRNVIFEPCLQICKSPQSKYSISQRK